MKKILFGLSAAIGTTIGVYSFKSTSSLNSYWFTTSASGNFPRATYPSVVTNAEINHPRIAVEPLGAKPGVVCNGTTHLCLVAFTTAQLTVNQEYLKTTALKPSFAVFSAAYTKI